MSGAKRKGGDVDAAVARLAAPVAPPRDLWPGILEAIEGEGHEDDAARLARALPTDILPPEDLWGRIRQGISGADPGDTHVPRRGPTRTSAAPAPSGTARVWGTAGFGVAATLVAGILIGRWSAELDVGAPGTATSPQPSVTASARLPLSSEIATSEHLQQAETLLLLFESAPASGNELAESAELLAARTRLLIDSPVGEDPAARSILLDLEYFLTQIGRLDDTPDATERELARESMAESTIVARLRQLEPEFAPQ